VLKLHSVILLILLLVASTSSFAGSMSGLVLDERGQPLFNINLDFLLVGTGDNVSPIDSDTTDLSGAYFSTLPPGIYDVTFTPPAGSRLAAHVVEAVNLNVDQIMLPITLLDAWFVSGTVTRGDTGLPAVGVDLDFKDLVTGLKLFTPRDNTDLLGVYSVAIPKGIYEVTFDGPEPDLITDPAQLAHGILEEVSVDGLGDVSVEPMVLELGYWVEGTVADPIGFPVGGADLDFLAVGTDEKIFTKQDNTDVSGDYATLVPAGTYDVEINPPANIALASIIRPDTVVLGDTLLGTDFLTTGVVASGVVRDPDGNLLPRVDLDFASTVSGSRIPTIFDDTDASGFYAVRLTGGAVDIDYGPLTNSLVLSQTNFGVNLPGDTTLADVILPYRDQDADGVVDLLDGCPMDADGTQLDQDLDGVGDLCDNCPAVANERQEDNDLDRVGDACDADDDNDGIADGLDSDLDGDTIANLDDNCPQAANPSQFDGDSDGAGDACDADDGEVEYLEARSSDGFVWRPESGATGYQVYRQRLGWLSAINYGRCFHDVTEGTMLFDPDLPEVGDGYVYLVTAVTALVEGSLGRDATGAVRPNLRACP